jgi:hypothetical protein
VAFRGQEYPFSYLRSPEISIDLGLFQHPARIDQMNTSIGQMDTRIDRVDSRIDRLHYWQLGLMGAIAASILTTILTRLL